MRLSYAADIVELLDDLAVSRAAPVGLSTPACTARPAPRLSASV